MLLKAASGQFKFNMCRFLVSRLNFTYLNDACLTIRYQIYKGLNEIRLSKLVTEPSHSILTQSYDSRLRLVCRDSTRLSRFEAPMSNCV